ARPPRQSAGRLAPGMVGAMDCGSRAPRGPAGAVPPPRRSARTTARRPANSSVARSGPLAPARLTESRLESKKRLERLGAWDHDTGRHLEHGKFHEGPPLGFFVQAA